MALSYGQISVSDVIARAKMQLGISSTTEHDIWFETLANEAARHLDCLSVTIKRTCKLDIDGTTACLPKGLKQFIALRFVDDCSGTSSTEDIQTVSQNTGNLNITTFSSLYSFTNNAVYADLKFLKTCGCDDDLGFYDHPNLFEIQGNTIFFHGTPPSTTALISFLGLNVDDNGMMLVYEDYERAMWNYICWCFCLQNFDRYPANLRSEYYSTWASQKAWIKSKEVAAHFKNTKRQVSEWANALVSDKNWTL